MLEKVALRNFGPIQNLNWPGLGSINLVIGENGCGKTFLLKALYSAVKTLEEYRRGDNEDSLSDILVKKLRWTFQTEKIGDLASKGAGASLSCDMSIDGKRFKYMFGKDTTKQIGDIRNNVPKREDPSVFLPSKEVLSLDHVILWSREQENVFGFDDTYFDLARILRFLPTRKGKNYPEFAQSRRALRELLVGRLEYDEASGRWFFWGGEQKFAIGITAEGIKKIAILDRLLGNHYLRRGSIVFIDEPEAALHPKAVSRLLDIVFLLAGAGLQFFLASHSYFVIKKLFLIAGEENISIPLLSFENGGWKTADLKRGIPSDNPIISESIRIYEEEVGLAFK